MQQDYKMLLTVEAEWLTGRNAFYYVLYFCVLEIFCNKKLETVEQENFLPNL